MEFVGDGVANLSVDYRIGIDVMTTETTCLSSIWETDDAVKQFYEIHGRVQDYKELRPGEVASLHPRIPQSRPAPHRVCRPLLYRAVYIPPCCCQGLPSLSVKHQALD